MLQKLKFTLLMGLVVALSACSHLGHKSAKNAVGDDRYDSAEVQTYGVGDQASFNGGSGNRAGRIDPELERQCPADVCFYFDLADSTVHQYEYAKMITQARYLASHPNLTVRVEGNTDERGSREYNLALGEHRSESVAELLRVKGADTKQMLVTSNGKEKPVALAHNEKGYKVNRRVDLYYCKTGQHNCG